MSKYKSIKVLFYLFIYLFLHYIRMEPTSQNNSIYDIQETRKLFNELRSNFSRE